MKAMENELKKGIYRFESFRLDPTRRLLFGENGQTVPLTPKAFDLLLILVENQGKLLKKDELIEKLWSDSFVEEGNLTQTISVLRKALGEKRKEHRFIVTVPGQGYRFVSGVIGDFEPNKPEGDSSDLSTSAERDDSNRENIRPPLNFVRPLVRPKPLILFLSAATLLGVGLIGFLFYRPAETSRPPAQINEIKTIAVLPFRMIEEDENAAQLGLGMTDTLVLKLSQLKKIIVRPTNTVLRYSENTTDPLAIGRELKVDALLDGSIQRDEDRIRINVRLIRVIDGATLWTDTFVDNFTNIFSLQDRISEKVVGSLELKITGEEEKLIKKRYTENIEAYQFYQQGRFFWNKRTREDFLKAIDLFRRAIEKDPNYALPYTGLADSYHLLGDYGFLAPQDSILKAKESALKALELDNSLSEAHTSLAYAKFLYDWDWEGAEISFRHALDLNPNYPTAHQWYGEYLMAMGKTDAALSEIEKARELDPRSQALSAVTGWMYYIGRDFDRAIIEEQKSLETDPDFYPAHFWIGQSAEMKGDLGRAVKEYQISLKLSPDSPEVLASLGHSYALSGQKEKSREILEQLRKMSEKNYVSPYFTALIYSGLGDKERALVWLEKGSGDHSRALPFLKVDPMMDRLKAEPGFQELLRRMRL
ncbi:MAG: winged helix-turn-helix domain-containing protein [Pyrinomonadaceae bacterium]